jgi:integrase
MLKKDIYEFNREELDDLFMSFGSRSEASVASRISIINKYIDFAIEEGFLSSKINLVNNFSGEEYYKKYVSKVAENRKILNKKEFDDLIDFCVNAQDAAIFVLLYEGARGRQIKESPLEELRNLKWEDVNEIDNTLTLKRDNGEIRKISVSSKTIEILRDANNQQKYIKKNGELSDWLAKRKNTHLLLINTGYILTPTIQGSYGKITKQNIMQRINTIRKHYGNLYITVNNIWVSGMLEYAKKIKREQNKTTLSSKDYEEVCKRFGQDEAYWYKVKQRIEKYL